jgi:hypothetical protein
VESTVSPARAIGPNFEIVGSREHTEVYDYAPRTFM